MIKLLLDQPALTHRGERLQSGDTYGQIVANMLAVSSSTSPRKRMSWVKLLMNNEPIQLDGDDFDALFKAVTESNLCDFIKVFVLDSMTAARQ